MELLECVSGEEINLAIGIIQINKSRSKNHTFSK